MKRVSLIAIAFVILGLSSCDYATSNVQTLITDDCGVTWKLIRPGQSIPKGVANPCHYKVTVPDYPMQGDLKFKTSFKNRVLADIEVSYDYYIVDAIQFIGEAKYLGKSNANSDDKSNESSAYETAENSVIDKRIKEAATELLIEEDIVDFSQADFEDKLLAEVNKMLKDKGIVLNFLNFVPIPEDQTRQAIDVVTALKIYESKGLLEIGKIVTTSRAGATKIEIVVKDNDK